jgi:hypothetical protein
MFIVPLPTVFNISLWNTAILDCSFSQPESRDYFAKGIKADNLNMCLKLSLLVKSLSKRQSEMLGDFFEMLVNCIDSIEAECIDNAGFCKNCTCKQCTNKQTLALLLTGAFATTSKKLHTDSTEDPKRTVLFHESVANTQNLGSRGRSRLLSPFRLY